MKSPTENAINADLKRLTALPMINAVIPKKSATSAAQDRVTCHVRSQPMTAEQLEELASGVSPHDVGLDRERITARTALNAYREASK